MSSSRLAIMFLCIFWFSGCDKDETPQPPPSENPLASTKWKLLGSIDLETEELTEVTPKDCEECYTLEFYDAERIFAYSGYYMGTIQGVTKNYDISYEINSKLSTIKFHSVESNLMGYDTEEGSNYAVTFYEIQTFELKDTELKLYYNDNNNYLLFSRRLYEN